MNQNSCSVVLLERFKKAQALFQDLQKYQIIYKGCYKQYNGIDDETQRYAQITLILNQTLLCVAEETIDVTPVVTYRCIIYVTN